MSNKKIVFFLELYHSIGLDFGLKIQTLVNPNFYLTRKSTLIFYVIHRKRSVPCTAEGGEREEDEEGEEEGDQGEGEATHCCLEEEKEEEKEEKEEEEEE